MKHRLIFSAPVLTASGYGVHARQLLAALRDADEFDICVESLRWGETPFLTGPEFDWIKDLAAKTIHTDPQISIQVTIPNEFKRRAPISIGVTAGIEVDRVSPQWLLKCNSEVDFVIVPSEHSRTAFLVEYQAQDGAKLRLERPIFVVHEGVDTKIYRPNLALSPLLDDLGVPSKNFVFTGLGLDKANGRDRKNVTRLIEWFCKAFPNNDRVGLILKVAIVNGSTVDFEIVKRRIAEIKKLAGAGDLPKIFLIHGRVPDEKLSEIYNDPRVMAMVSLTHGEGFGLPLIEAAACGLPVMATDWSGHLDFLTIDGKKLFVPFAYDMGELPQECVWEGVMEAGTSWAEVKEADVLTKLQKMTLSSVTPRKWADELVGNISQRFNLKVTGDAFVNLVRQATAELMASRPASRDDFIGRLRGVVRAKGRSLVYTMPMSAGDVFLSTGVIAALRDKHPDCNVYFATSPQYFDILKNLERNGRPLIDELIEWQQWMHDVGVLEDVFDEVYTPNLAVQMTWSNWVHRGKGRNLIDEFAAQCGVQAQEPITPSVTAVSRPKTVVIHSGGQKSARAYSRWSELVQNLRSYGIKVVQVGAKDDISVGTVDEDLRGKTDHAGLVSVLSSGAVFVGIDSYPMHVAAVVGAKVVAIFGSSYTNSTGPKNFRPPCDRDVLVDRDLVRLANRRLTLIETPDRKGCERACYKDVCKVDTSNPCINNIEPKIIFNEIAEHLEIDELQYKEYRPKIAGYTHILNPLTHGYPFVQSIKSMLDFCDEVVVVDGGSNDGSIEKLRSALGSYEDLKSLRIITRKWDPDEPGMDGMQKAFGRAMVSPDMEFLWQQDADEIVHHDDYPKIVDLCRRFPADVDVLHLPVIELWGDDRHVRTDRHSWKWRLTRNNLRVTHGIAMQARMVTSEGRIYAKEGMSDGCEFIDMVTGQHLPHRGFYTADLDKLRLSNPEEYGKQMNATFKMLPSVWHYSWADLPRKVRNFRDFWDKQWQVLYQTTAKPRFPDVITDDDVMKKAEELRVRGGEHGPAPTFLIDREPPKVGT